MSVAVCFYVEPNGSCGKQIRLEQWTALAQSFGVGRLLVVDRTGFDCFDPKSQISLTVHKTLADAFGEFPRATVVLADKNKGVPYHEYEPPAGDVIYCFGSDTAGYRGEAPAGCDWLTIPADSKYELWAVQAATLVMGDRWRRGNP